MDTVWIKTKTQQYPVLIGSGLSTHLASWQPYLRSQQILIVTDDTVAPLYLSALEALFTGVQLDTVILPDGEQHKNLASYQVIIDTLVHKHHHRNSNIIALGGGVVCDIAGFVASSYQRGSNLILLPTTLLAQVDAAIGGKNAVNHSHAKNLMGSIYQPSCVVADLDLLQTLEPRHYTAGLAEVIKYALILDAEFLKWLENNLAAILLLDTKAVEQMIVKCCEYKAQLIAEDVDDRGRRALLNFGHTFGHAIEAATEYKHYLHGEAVAIGMLMAADMSERLGYISADNVARIEDLIIKMGLPTEVSHKLKTKDIIEHMAFDKKILAKDLRFILLESIGKAKIQEISDTQLIESIIEARLQ